MAKATRQRKIKCQDDAVLVVESELEKIKAEGCRFVTFIGVVDENGLLKSTIATWSFPNVLFQAAVEELSSFFGIDPVTSEQPTIKTADMMRIERVVENKFNQLINRSIMGGSNGSQEKAE